ncbi:rod shape-determining protein RodA [Luminiphilus sp.]|jgi:rod shape determining protein RodA|nr:rod shape-determining protein RodA [Luminiphilus sp.]MDA9836347.1 rod shape-determining protein RodA [Luminiphilus sp.]MDA9878063.1 rod shape-determining protein RodA [Luminiphilus sp.]MDB2659330.1 rod shape-determining protein RodA [Luminiphilus sp.]MDC0508072.1 rod shape-determining protein RodA [Luminiphilus sp.]
MSNDFSRNAHVSSRELGSRTRILHALHIDPWLMLPLIALSVSGLFVLYSASGQSDTMLMTQIRNLGVAFFVLLVTAQLKVATLKGVSPYIFSITVVLLIGVAFFGVGAKGAQRWLDLGFIRFQPSEVMKVAMPLAVAWWLSKKALAPARRELLIAFLMVALPSLLILGQPDLGTSLLVAISGLSVIFMAGIQWRYILSMLFLTGLSIWPAWLFVLKDYQKQRVLTLFNPESDRLGAGWNIIQSKTAIGSGGWEGLGWTQGSQAQLDFLPEGHTDFIIAVLAEEFGFRGVALLFLLYALILVRGLIISWRAQSSFARLLAGALIATFFFGLIVNLGMVSGLLPVVGVPLPMVSWGGTAMVSMMIAFGMLMAISTEHSVTQGMR